MFLWSFGLLDQAGPRGASLYSLVAFSYGRVVNTPQLLTFRFRGPGSDTRETVDSRALVEGSGRVQGGP